MQLVDHPVPIELVLAAQGRALDMCLVVLVCVRVLEANRVGILSILIALWALQHEHVLFAVLVNASVCAAHVMANYAMSSTHAHTHVHTHIAGETELHYAN